MEKIVENLYKAAAEDIEFVIELKIHEPKNYKPSIFWSDLQKISYSCIYMGWLIGKDRYNEADYL